MPAPARRGERPRNPDRPHLADGPGAGDFPPSPPRAAGRSRGDHAYLALRNAIRGGQLRPGRHLREVDVAAWLGLSRTPVREAIRRLVSEGLLAQGPWNGAVVVELDAEQVVELYAVRESLEGTAASLVAAHATEAEIRRLRNIVAREPAAFGHPARLVELNDRFHDALYRAAHNRYLLQALTAVVDTLGLVKHSIFVLPGSDTGAHRQHAAIVDAVERRDGAAAERLAREHVRDSLELRLELMRQSEEK